MPAGAGKEKFIGMKTNWGQLFRARASHPEKVLTGRTKQSVCGNTKSIIRGAKYEPHPGRNLNRYRARNCLR